MIGVILLTEKVFTEKEKNILKRNKKNHEKKNPRND